MAHLTTHSYLSAADTLVKNHELAKENSASEPALAASVAQPTSHHHASPLMTTDGVLLPVALTGLLREQRDDLRVEIGSVHSSLEKSTKTASFLRKRCFRLASKLAIRNSHQSSLLAAHTRAIFNSHTLHHYTSHLALKSQTLQTENENLQVRIVATDRILALLSHEMSRGRRRVFRLASRVATRDKRIRSLDMDKDQAVDDIDSLNCLIRSSEADVEFVLERMKEEVSALDSVLSPESAPQLAQNDLTDRLKHDSCEWADALGTRLRNHCNMASQLKMENNMLLSRNQTLDKTCTRLFARSSAADDSLKALSILKADAEEQLEEFKSQLTTLDASFQERDRTHTQIEAEWRHSSDSLKQQLSQNRSQMGLAVSNHESIVQHFQSQLQSGLEERRRLCTELSHANNAFSDAVNQHKLRTQEHLQSQERDAITREGLESQLAQSIQLVDTTREELDRKEGEFQAKIKSLESEIYSSEQHLVAAKTELVSLSTRETDLLHQVSILQNDITDVRQAMITAGRQAEEDHHTLSQTIDELQRSVTELSDREREALSQRDSLLMEKADLESSLQEFSHVLSESQEREGLLSEELETARSLLEGAAQKNSIFEAELTQQKLEYENRNGSLETSVSRQTADNESLFRSVNMLRQELVSSENVISSVQIRYKVATEEIQELGEQLQTTRSELRYFQERGEQQLNLALDEQKSLQSELRIASESYQELVESNDIDIAALEKSLDEKTTMIETERANAAELMAEQDELTRRLHIRETDLSDLRNELVNALKEAEVSRVSFSTAQTELSTQIENLKGEVSGNEVTIQIQDDVIARLHNDMESDGLKLSAVESSNTTLLDQVQVSTNKITECEGIIQTQNEVIARLHRDMELDAQKLTVVEGSKIELQDQVHDFKGRISQSDEIIQTQNSVISRLQNEVESGTQKLSVFEGSKIDLEDLVEVLRAKITEYEATIRSQTEVIVRLQHNIELDAQKLSVIEASKINLQGQVQDSKVKIKNSQQGIFKAFTLATSWIQQMKSQIDGLSKDKLLLQDVTSELKTEVSTLSNANTTLGQTLELTKSESQAVQSNLEETILHKSQELDSKQAELDRSIKTHTIELAEVKKQAQELETAQIAAKADHESKISDAEKRLNELLSQKVELETVLEGMEFKQTESDRSLENYITELSEARERAHELEVAQLAARVDYENKIADVEKRLDELLSEKDNLQYVIVEMESKQAESDRSLETHIVDLAEVTKRAQELETAQIAARVDHECKIADAEKRLDELLSQKDNLQNVLVQMESKQTESDRSLETHILDLAEAKKRAQELESAQIATNAAHETKIADSEKRLGELLCQKDILQKAIMEMESSRRDEIVSSGRLYGQISESRDMMEQELKDLKVQLNEHRHQSEDSKHKFEGVIANSSEKINQLEQALKTATSLREKDVTTLQKLVDDLMGQHKSEIFEFRSRADHLEKRDTVLQETIRVRDTELELLRRELNDKLDAYFKQSSVMAFEKTRFESIIESLNTQLSESSALRKKVEDMSRARQENLEIEICGAQARIDGQSKLVTHLQKMISDHEIRKCNLENFSKSLEERVEQTSVEKGELRQRVTDLECESKQFESRAKTAEDATSGLEGLIMVLQDHVSVLQCQLESVKAEVVSERMLKSHAQTKLNSATSLATELEKHISDNAALATSHGEKIADGIRENAILSKELEQSEEALEVAYEKMRSTERHLELASETISRLEQLLETSEQSLNTVGDVTAQCGEQLDHFITESELQLAEISRESSVRRRNLNKALEQVAELRETNTQLSGEKGELLKKVDNLETQVSTLSPLIPNLATPPPSSPSSSVRGQNRGSSPTIDQVTATAASSNVLNDEPLSPNASRVARLSLRSAKSLSRWKDRHRSRSKSAGRLLDDIEEGNHHPQPEIVSAVPTLVSSSELGIDAVSAMSTPGPMTPSSSTVVSTRVSTESAPHIMGLPTPPLSTLTEEKINSNPASGTEGPISPSPVYSSTPLRPYAISWRRSRRIMSLQSPSSPASAPPCDGLHAHEEESPMPTKLTKAAPTAAAATGPYAPLARGLFFSWRKSGSGQNDGGAPVKDQHAPDAVTQLGPVMETPADSVPT